MDSIGEGLSYPLKDFGVTLKPGEPAQLKSIKGSSQEASRWTIWDIAIGTDYVGAVAVKGKGLVFKQWTLDQDFFSFNSKY